MGTHCVLFDLCSNPGVLLPRVLELVQQRLWRADGVRRQSPGEELSRARVSPRHRTPERQGPEDGHLAGVNMVSQDQTGRQDVLLLEAKETQETDVGGRTRKRRSATVALNEGVINDQRNGSIDALSERSTMRPACPPASPCPCSVWVGRRLLRSSSKHAQDSSHGRCCWS